MPIESGRGQKDGSGSGLTALTKAFRNFLWAGPAGNLSMGSNGVAADDSINSDGSSYCCLQVNTRVDTDNLIETSSSLSIGQHQQCLNLCLGVDHCMAFATS
jgi:hypothetical protein